jgi:Fur family transcriptional regulator, ferric uptake regulator
MNGMPAGATPAPRRRQSSKRDAVVHQLARSDRFRSAQQLFHEMYRGDSHDDGGKMALTTIYRILRALSDEDIAETQRAEDGETLYRLRRDSEHQHYLLCRRCGRAVAFAVDGVESYTRLLAQAHHYSDVTHYLDLYGTCPRCRPGRS